MTEIKIISILNDTNDCLCMFSVRFVFKERDIRAICIVNDINDYTKDCLCMFRVRFVFKERDMRAICILNHNNDYLRMFSVRLSKERDLNMVNLMRE